MNHNLHVRQYQGPMELDHSPTGAAHNTPGAMTDGGRPQFDRSQLGLFSAVGRNGTGVPKTTIAPFATAALQQSHLQQQQQQQHQQQQQQYPYPQQQGLRGPSMTKTSSSSSQASQETARPRKVPIPKASTESLQPRRRSARACEPCRQRKIKCDGNKPTCKQCGEHGAVCVFLDVKRVRDQKQMALLLKQVKRYEEILKELVSEVDSGTAGRIRKALKVGTPLVGRC